MKSIIKRTRIDFCEIIGKNKEDVHARAKMKHEHEWEHPEKENTIDIVIVENTANHKETIPPFPVVVEEAIITEERYIKLEKELKETNDKLLQSQTVNEKLKAELKKITENDSEDDVNSSEKIKE